MDYSAQFRRADTNRNGKVDQQEFRSFCGPIKQTQPGTFTKEDEEAFNNTPVIESYTYEIGLDVAWYGFVEDPYKYEQYSAGLHIINEHSYPLGIDVAYGAPDNAHKWKQYDPAGSMFYFADMNHDMQLDEIEFNYLMRSI
ncbi:unnamed protein product [Adineta steineri]|uniref:EF-hand domain-containing protein n=1 Tax=Adineta steineri TaxID=433720 RepID=A0A815IJV5_9BILA|nr:unnamed protein product [Adineta steineri]CAF4011608.1 unnamed protein product [Adineta steineri]